MSKAKEEIKDQVAIGYGWRSFDAYYQQGNKIDVLAMMDEIMESYSQQQLSEYKQKLKAEIEGNAFKTDERNASVITVNDVLTLIDKI